MADVNTAAWSPDGTRVVTASSDDTARIWNADGSGQPIVLEGHNGVVETAAWSPDGTRVVTASIDQHRSDLERRRLGAADRARRARW